MPVVEHQRYAEVSKVYRDGTADAVEAVSSVSFWVPRGQFVAILGPTPDAFFANRFAGKIKLPDAEWAGLRQRVAEYDKYLG